MIYIQNNSSYPYLLDIKHGWQDKDIQPIIKLIPGWACSGPPDWKWTIPIEFGEMLIKALRSQGKLLEIKYDHDLPVSAETTQFQSGYQHLSVLAALSSLSGYIYNFSPGLGKTAAVIETLKLGGIKKGLIVCPAMVRKTWEREFEKWWPEAGTGEDSPLFNISEGARKSNSKSARNTSTALSSAIALGNEVKTSSDPLIQPEIFIVTSYGLLPKVLEQYHDSFNPEAIVFDEVHSLQHVNTKQFKSVQAVIEKYPKARRYGLTGTLFTNGIINAWGPLSTIFPKRYGTRHHFGERYTQANYNGFGWEYPGVAQENISELKWRLGLISYRATEADLPPGTKIPTLSIEEIDETEDWDLEDWVSHYQAAGDSRIAILTYNVDKAKLYADQLTKCGNVACLTGDDLPAKRDQKLQDIIGSARNGVVCATISSIKIGINEFANFPLVLLTDLSDNLEEMTQAILRFRRKGAVISRVRGYMLTNKITMPKALRLKRKLNAISAVLSLGSAEGTMQEAFVKQNEYSSEEWQAAINDILGSKTEDGE